MFTGIVNCTGSLERLQEIPSGRRLILQLPPDRQECWSDLALGESVAIDGCCLTLVKISADFLSFDVLEETLRCTNLADRRPGDALNLERALRVGDRLGGHYVTGHVDATGRVAEVSQGSKDTRLTVEIPVGASVQVIQKGSIALDGVSLTVAAVEPSKFTVALIPHTLAVTNLSDRQVGDRVNLEMDQIGRWVKSLLNVERGQNSIPDGAPNAQSDGETQ